MSFHLIKLGVVGEIRRGSCNPSIWEPNWRFHIVWCWHCPISKRLEHRMGKELYLCTNMIYLNPPTGMVRQKQWHLLRAQSSWIDVECGLTQNHIILYDRCYAFDHYVTVHSFIHSTEKRRRRRRKDFWFLCSPLILSKASVLCLLSKP